VSGPRAEDAPPLVFTRIGGRAMLASDPLAWPLRIDTGVLGCGEAWTVLACGQDGCGAHLVEVTEADVRTGDWPVTLGELVGLVADHASECEALGG
jgi:hypothetical protein